MKLEVVCHVCMEQPATTEVQSGWDPRKNNGAGGGVYTPVCEQCRREEEEASGVNYSRQTY